VTIASVLQAEIVGADGGQGQTDSFGSKSDNSGKSRPTFSKIILTFALQPFVRKVMIKICSNYSFICPEKGKKITKQRQF